jgi:hypothetical protein
MLVFALAAAVGCGDKRPPSTADVVAMARQGIPEDPGDPAWNLAPQHVESLHLQDLVEPRLTEISTREIRVRAFADRERLAFRLEWEDPTRDDLPGVMRFTDACAVQLPERAERDAPDPQMGHRGRAVRITYWSASWQAAADGRPDTIESLYPGATVDHYPFEAAPLVPGSQAGKEMTDLYAPARALGNRMAGPPDRPVQDLIAEGPGTLTPAREQRSAGRGVRTEKGWAVVISLPLPEGLASSGQTQVAFAALDGARQEAGSRKMRSPWVPLILEEAK